MHRAIDKTRIKAQPRNVIEPRPWQLKVLNKFKNERFTLNKAPGGSGKSLVQCMLGALDIGKTGNKQLLLVPQNHIHHGFVGDGVIVFRLCPGDRLRKWSMDLNLCAGKAAQTTNRLIDFLQSDSGPPQTAIASHRAMVLAWRSMTRQQRQRSVQRMSFRIDEAHHIKGVFEADEESGEEFDDVGNGLGSFVQYAVNQDSSHTQLHLTTATFYRGDRHEIMTQAIQKEFVDFELPWSQYYAELGLENFEYDFVTYDETPIASVIHAIRLEPQRRHLVILPSRGRAFRSAGTLDSLLTPLYSLFGREGVLDLVTPSSQAEAKAALLARPDSFRTVVACRLFDEGTDWPICDRMHNTDACERSMTLAVQRFFRPFRYHRKKRSVKIVNYLPAFRSDMDADSKRAVLSDRFNAVLACVVTAGELVPVRMGADSGITNNDQSDAHPTLQDAYGHNAYIELVHNLITEYENLGSEASPAQIEVLINLLIARHGVPPGVEPEELRSAVERQLMRIVAPQPRRLGANDLSSGFDSGAIARLGFDKVWLKHKHRSLLRFGTDHISAEEIRQLMHLTRRTFSRAEIVDGIRRFTERTGSRPTFSTGWIKELGTTSSALEKQLRRHFGTTLAQEVDRVLGTKLPDDLVEQAVEVIRLYDQRGIRLSNKYGAIPELETTSFALNGKLQYHHQITLAALVDQTLGAKHVFDLNLQKVRKVLAAYARRGVLLNRKFGFIPELDTSSFNLCDRLRRSHGITLAAAVKSEVKAMGD
ncbi:MAG: hypothetical protein QM754_17440 [Tepidisphaeraceae bacterium]